MNGHGGAFLIDKCLDDYALPVAGLFLDPSSVSRSALLMLWQRGVISTLCPIRANPHDGPACISVGAISFDGPRSCLSNLQSLKACNFVLPFCRSTWRAARTLLTMLLPEIEGEFAYRIRNPREAHERIAKESELYR